MSRLPPSQDRDRLSLELRFVPASLKSDAVQEAWIAHLTGRSPVRAVKAFTERERRYRRKAITSVASVS